MERTMALLLMLCGLHSLVHRTAEGLHYDYSASTECKSHSEPALYQGGILTQSMGQADVTKNYRTENGTYSPGFLLNNLTGNTIYSFSCWVQIKGRDSALIRARLNTASGASCIGTTLARSHCWSFLKGGFVLDSPSKSSLIYFKASDLNDTVILVKSASLQPFSPEQWNQHRDDSIQMRRKRFITVHVSNAQGNRVKGANVTAQQLSKDFPFGSAISSVIIGNKPYQEWFAERFNAAVFENELKWYATEPQPGKLSYTSADKMLEFVREHQIMVRGHNIFWEDPKYTPAWVRNLTGDALKAAVNSRIRSLLRSLLWPNNTSQENSIKVLQNSSIGQIIIPLLYQFEASMTTLTNDAIFKLSEIMELSVNRYKGDFVHWDVSNEMLHFNFYEERLGANATLGFFQTAKEADPLTTLFMNDFNVVETCEDDNASVDNYVVRLKQLMQGGEGMLQGIGLEGHFGKPNIPLMRAVLDKLATLRLPVWLTEIDISRTLGLQNQAAYLEDVLREGFSHPSMHGIMLWTALQPSGTCYQMCLTDTNFHNLPAGDVVDKLLKEWQSRDIKGNTNMHGSYSFSAFLGEYQVSVSSGNVTKSVTFNLDGSQETKHINIQL